MALVSELKDDASLALQDGGQGKIPASELNWARQRLKAGDIVYVPFSPFRRVGQLAEILLNEFVSSIALNEGTRAVSKNAGPVGVSIGVGLTPGK